MGEGVQFKLLAEMCGAATCRQLTATIIRGTRPSSFTVARCGPCSGYGAPLIGLIDARRVLVFAFHKNVVAHGTHIDVKGPADALERSRGRGGAIEVIVNVLEATVTNYQLHEYTPHHENPVFTFRAFFTCHK
jgi:hypothetical protein